MEVVAEKRWMVEQVMAAEHLLRQAGVHQIHPPY